MDTIYQTSDGERFKGVTGEIDALDHQRRIDSLGRPDPNYVDHAKNNREEACSNLNKASACVDNGEYEKAIELCNNNMTFLNAVGKSEEVPPKILANAYNTRGVAYDKLGNKEQAIADYKQAVDVDKNQNAKDNLARLGIQYPPSSHDRYGNLITPQPGDDLVEQALEMGIYGDKKKKFKLYEKAANMGNANAQCELAYYYYAGDVVREDIKKYIYWKEKSAEQGHLRAMRDLGIDYRDGEGVNQNFAKAEELFNKAIAGGYSDARKELEKLKKMRGK